MHPGREWNWSVDGLEWADEDYICSPSNIESDKLWVKAHNRHYEKKSCRGSRQSPSSRSSLHNASKYIISSSNGQPNLSYGGSLARTARNGWYMLLQRMKVQAWRWVARTPGGLSLRRKILFRLGSSTIAIRSQHALFMTRNRPLKQKQEKEMGKPV